MNNSLGIIQPGSIGDMVIVLPIAKWYHDKGYKVFWPVVTPYLSMLNYVKYVEPIDAGVTFLGAYQRSIQELKDRDIDNMVDLGIGFGKDESEWAASGLSFDEWKYREAKVPFEERFNLSIDRNFQKEAELEVLLDIANKKSFVVTHSAGSWNRVNFGKSESIEVVPKDGFTVFDWVGIIEKAEHVYCVDSCVAHVVNQLGLLKGRRTFRAFSSYGGRPLTMSIPNINWETD